MASLLFRKTIQVELSLGGNEQFQSKDMNHISLAPLLQ